MKIRLIFLLSLLSMFLQARPPDPVKLLERGELLYRLELGSWYGTDNFIANFPDLRDSIGGYLSYVNSENNVVTIFFSRTIPVQILVRFTFEGIPNMIPISVETDNRQATSLESDLIRIRMDAIRRIQNDAQGFFSVYENTSLNPIPLITRGERLVYILTATNESGYLFIGNDYLLTYDKANNFKKQKKIHNSLLQFSYEGSGNAEDKALTYHSHVLSEAIDVTDICTLLLYRNYLKWDQHYVISKKYVSIFDMKAGQLVIMKRKAWDKLQQKDREEEE
ncbi:MAG: hypothetical protein JW801_13490 [Bacteroidales bacterium]|nr:hypothetical protein [Bacteroidales bacterium]